MLSRDGMDTANRRAWGKTNPSYRPSACVLTGAVSLDMARRFDRAEGGPSDRLAIMTFDFESPRRRMMQLSVGLQKGAWVMRTWRNAIPTAIDFSEMAHAQVRQLLSSGTSARKFEPPRREDVMPELAITHVRLGGGGRANKNAIEGVSSDNVLGPLGRPGSGPLGSQGSGWMCSHSRRYMLSCVSS